MKELHEWHSLWTYGQMEAYWIAFYQFMETIGVRYDKKDAELLELWAQTAKSCSWFWCFENIVFVSDRPTRLEFDSAYRLHNEHGPSYAFSDGWSGHYLHGVNFPKDLWERVVKREMEAKEILEIEDIDQRVQAMKFAKNGLRDFYKDEDGKCIDEHVKLDVKGRPVKYELWEIPEGKTFNQKVWFMIYNCPSAIEMGEEREYAKGVPEFKKVKDAMAWGMSGDSHILKPGEWVKLIPLEHES